MSHAKRFAVLTMLMSSTVASGAGCGLANGIAHVEHPFYFDEAGFCAACGRDGSACEIDDDEDLRKCRSVTEFQDCDFGSAEDGRDDETLDLILSPAPGEFLSSDVTGSDDCVVELDAELGELVVELIAYDPGHDSPFQNRSGPNFGLEEELGVVTIEANDENTDTCIFANDDVCDEPTGDCNAGTDSTDCGRPPPTVFEWEAERLDDDGNGDVFLVTLTLCVPPRFDDTWAVRVKEPDGDEGNFLCVSVIGNEDEDE